MICTEREKFDSDKFWINNYEIGYNSGLGSYGANAIFKANFINNYCKKYKLKTAIEYGCGDGNNLGLYKFNKYIGYDISNKAIEMCKARYNSDKSKEFYIIEGSYIQQADVSLCVDVIYHIFPESKYQQIIELVIDRAKHSAIFYTTLTPDKRVVDGCMNDYDFINFIDKLCKEKGYTYFIDKNNAPESSAKFVVIKK